MSDIEALPEIGSQAFWKLYDEFCCAERFAELSSKNPAHDLCLKLQEILRAGHMEIVKLARPEKGWDNPKAWLVLRYEMVLHLDGSGPYMYLEAGDVMTRHFQWDRDTFVTQVPIQERVAGQFLPQNWPNAERGLFLPLYDKRTIFSAVRAKLGRNLACALDRVEKESEELRWY